MPDCCIACAVQSRVGGYQEGPEGVGGGGGDIQRGRWISRVGLVI